MFILIGIVTTLFGILVAGAGLRLFFLLLPIWGFVVGFLVGAGVIAAVLGDGFLATTLGIGCGLAVGIAFAFLSYLYWYVAVLLSAGAAGFMLGAALLGTLGVSADWLIFIAGLAVGAIFVAGALAINYPVFIVIFATAAAGASIALAGILVLLGHVDASALGTGETWRLISANPLLWLIWFVGTLVGVGAQLSTRSHVTLPEDRWEPVTGRA